MRILAAWDNAEEADLVQLYLGNENELCLAPSAQEMVERAGHADWDVILMPMSFPETPREGYLLYKQLQDLQGGVPIVVVCKPEEMVSLPKFMNAGLRFYLVRDAGGNYLFLLLSTLESAVAAVEAERSRELAERLREEMDGVRKLQESIIPRGVTPPPGYGFVARYEPAQVTVVGSRPVVMAGGDYYDFFRPDDSTMVFLVGDASGHGLKACMSIMAMHTLVRMFSGDRYRDTARFVAEINNRLCENSIVQSEGGFITLYYAAVDSTRHTMTWTSAGHPFALLQNLQTNEVTQIGTEDDGGLPLGITAALDYGAQTCFIPPLSRVLFYTDGLTDALSEKAAGPRAFGVAGIMDVMRRCRGSDLETTLGELFAGSSGFTGGMGRHDDTSVVLLERRE
ncbi:MAG: fused response regulator/phosphatase [Gemmataceae bacterium]